MKFKIGDRARVKYIRNGGSTRWYVGVIVTIVNATPIIDEADCTVITESGLRAYPIFDQLEPIIKLRGSWKMIELYTGWNPSKEKLNEQTKSIK